MHSKYSSQSSCEHKNTIQQSVPTPINKTHKLESHRSTKDPIWLPSRTNHMLRQCHNYNRLSLPSHSKYLCYSFYLKYDRLGHSEMELLPFWYMDFVLVKVSRFKFQFLKKLSTSNCLFSTLDHLSIINGFNQL